MIKYHDYMVTFTEVPDECSLCFNLTNCPCNCKECFEPWLQDDIGSELTVEVIKSIYSDNHYCTCICFMGGDNDYRSLLDLIRQCRKIFPQLKFAMYSGREWREDLATELDYYKIGPYIPKKGPLNKVTTNQKFFKKDFSGSWQNITYRFYDKTE